MFSADGMSSTAGVKQLLFIVGSQPCHFNEHLMIQGHLHIKNTPRPLHLPKDIAGDSTVQAVEKVFSPFEPQQARLVVLAAAQQFARAQDAATSWMLAGPMAQTEQYVAADATAAQRYRAARFHQDKNRPDEPHGQSETASMLHPVVPPPHCLSVEMAVWLTVRRLANTKQARAGANAHCSASARRRCAPYSPCNWGWGGRRQ